MQEHSEKRLRSNYSISGIELNIYNEDVDFFVHFVCEKILHLKRKNKKLRKKLKKHKSGSANIPSPPPPPFDRKLKEGGYVIKPKDFNIFKK